MTEPNVLKAGKEVRIIFSDNKTLTCKIQAVDRYNLYVQHLETARNLIIYKHAIKYIDLGKKE